MTQQLDGDRQIALALASEWEQRAESMIRADGGYRYAGLAVANRAIVWKRAAAELRRKLGEGS